MLRIKTNIVFLYADALRRDLSTCFILEQLLNERGFRTFICSRRNFSRFFSLIIPRKLFVLGQIDSFYKQYIQHTTMGHNIDIFFMPSEGFLSNSQYKLVYPDAFEFSNLAAIFFWGRNSLRWFKENRKIDDPNKLKQAGYSRLPIAREYRAMVRRDKKIGFIGRFAALNDIYKRNLLSFYLTDPSILNRAQTEARQEIESRAIICYLDLFDFIINNTKFHVSIRPHPNEDVSTYRHLAERYGNRFEVNLAYDVAEWMAGCHALVGVSSFSYVDAYVAQTPVICLDNYLKSRSNAVFMEPVLEWMYECCHLPNSLDEVKSLLADNNLKPVVTDRFNNLIKEEFTGNSDLVFDQVISELVMKPLKRKLSDSVLLFMLKATDFILASLTYLVRKNKMSFDYSYHYHRIPVVLNDISTAIKTRVNAAFGALDGERRRKRHD